MKDLTEKTLAMRRGFEGRALTVDILDVELPGGRRTTREVVRHRGAAVILARRPDGTFIFVRQYRKAVERTLLEVSAGCIEPGEPVDACAVRELAEETGYRAIHIEKLGVIVPCAGYSEELLHLYFAEVGQAPESQNLDSDENLEPVVLSAEEIARMIASGEICDGKSIAIWHLYLTRRGTESTKAV